MSHVETHVIYCENGETWRDMNNTITLDDEHPLFCVVRVIHVSPCWASWPNTELVG